VGFRSGNIGRPYFVHLWGLCSLLPHRVHCWFALHFSKTSLVCHGAGDRLARLLPPGLLGCPELPELVRVVSVDSEIDGRKLRFLVSPGCFC